MVTLTPTDMMLVRLQCIGPPSAGYGYGFGIFTSGPAYYDRGPDLYRRDDAWRRRDEGPPSNRKHYEKYLVESDKAEDAMPRSIPQW